MKHKFSICTMAFLFAAALLVPHRLAAQSQPQYRVVNLGTLGGATAGADSLNNLGWASGYSNVAGNDSSTLNATLWLGTTPINLGTLGGANSAVLWPVKNNIGLITGVAETAELNPLGEEWSCSAFFPTTTLHNCVGFAWLFGKMFPLPTLGGYNAFATGSNDFAQIVGWAENNVHDSTCNGRNQVLQFEAVVWGPRPGEIHALPPFPGDLDGAATAINDQGQIVGISGICNQAVGAYTAIHALLWQNGQPINLGNLGGHGWNTPMAINNRGVVVGFADLPGDVVDGQLNANFIGFVWTKENGMQAIPVLEGDSIVEATGINNLGQIVGVSFGNPLYPLGRAFIYENGKVTDLNTLIPEDSPLFLTGNTDLDINDRGEIVGQACVVSDGACTADLPAFKLIPVCDSAAASAATRAAVSSATPAHSENPQSRMRPDDVQTAIAQRRGFVRFIPVSQNQK
jgi:probable HAF family extracellular repeat protein